MTGLRRDLRYAVRQLGRAPGFTVAAVVILGLGIGFSTAIFSAVDHILLRPLDLPGSERLVRLCEEHPEEGCFSVSPPNAASWSEESATLSAVGLARETGVRLRRDGASIGVGAAFHTPGLFDALGLEVEQGRLVGEGDMLPGGDGRVVVVSHGFWQSELGAAPDIVGSTLVLDEAEHTVIGVLPEGVEVPMLSYQPRLWLPLRFDPRAEENRGWRGFRGYGRLAAGATAAEAQSELRSIQAALAERYPDVSRGWGAQVQPMKEVVVGRARPLLLLFLGAVGAVLLVVSLNLASLLLARATTREQEFAVRAALGAERRVLVRQLLVESGALALLGAVLGVLVAVWATDLFVALAPASVPRIAEVAVDGRILVFTLVVTAASALIFGLAPATSLRRMELEGGLKGTRGGATRNQARLRRGLVVFELAVSLVLVLTAGLLLRSFSTLARWDPGFEVESLLTFQLYPPTNRYESREELAILYRAARERLAAIPGVSEVGTASAGPLFGGADGMTPFLVAGRPALPIQDAPRVAWYDAGPGYFPALGMPILAGRNLEETDQAGRVTTALVNEAMARRHWGDASPVGARLSLPEWEAQVEVVGVVPNLRPFLPDEAPQPSIYVSNRQRPRWATFFVLRTAAPPGDVAPAVRAAIREVDAALEPVALRPLQDYFRAQLVAPRFNTALVGLFALVALMLGMAGMYAVMAYAVASRRKELGIRMALGATGEEILRGVLEEGLRLVLAGVAIGVVGALAVGGLIRGLLHGVGPTDPWAVLGTVALLAASAAAAIAIPARRATRTDPLSVLRVE